MIKNCNQETRQYFDSLPAMLQENIMQSGVEITSKQDLENYVKNLLQN